MSKRRKLALGVVACAVVIAVVIYWLRPTSEQATATARLGSIDVTIQTVGSIQANDAVALRSAVSGTVVQLGVSAGDDVHVGDIIALLDRTPYENAVAEAQQNVARAEYALQLAEQRVATNPDDMAIKLDAISSRNFVQEAHTALAEAEEQLRQTTIQANASGQVIDLTIKVGDVIGQNQVVAHTITPHALELVADVDELDLPNVHTGAVVTFRLDAYPATELTGAVTSTSPTARLQGGATVFSAHVSYTPPAGIDIRPGMNADVTIVTNQRDGVLLIPQQALKTVGERAFVKVRTSNGTAEREVKLGYRGNGQVEIVEGLTEGDVVVLQ